MNDELFNHYSKSIKVIANCFMSVNEEKDLLVITKTAFLAHFSEDKIDTDNFFSLCNDVIFARNSIDRAEYKRQQELASGELEELEF